jgi:chromosome condensin MukBEF complex kleisin-like MukF subunit
MISNLLDLRLVLLGVFFWADRAAAAARLLDMRQEELSAEEEGLARVLTASYPERLHFRDREDFL